MKTRIAESSDVIVPKKALLAGAPLTRRMPASIILVATLIIAGCQQLPADHWSRKSCQPKASEAKNCYPTALPHLPVHK